jgi:hypothetical protein
MPDGRKFHDPDFAALYSASSLGLFPKPRSSIFRYVGMRSEESWAHLENTLLRNSLPLGISTNLNDPFEANPVVVNDTVSEDIQIFLKRFLVTPGITTWGLAFDFETILKSEDSEELEAKMLTEIRSLIDFRNQRCHIGSFSRRISSELQWSHYADGYKGLAYHFVTQPSEDSGFRFLKSVLYSKQRPIILFSELMDQLRSALNTEIFALSWLAFEQRSFLTKSVEWEYEQEERIIKQNEPTMTFLESELVSVVVGPRFTDANLERLKMIANKRKRPVKLFRAHPSPTSYSIEVDWSKEL